MVNKYLLLTILLFACKQALCQGDSLSNENALNELLQYKRIYAYADSINKTVGASALNNDVFNIARMCDSSHPVKYFEKALEQMQYMHLNEASFLFFLGNLRYRFYNSANPAYQPSEDGALAASLSYVAGEPIKMYLRTNPDNFVAILKASLDWYLKYDYTFYPKSKNPKKYGEQAEGINILIADIQKNNMKYKIDWQNERKETEKGFDSVIAQLKQNQKN